MADATAKLEKEKEETEKAQQEKERKQKALKEKKQELAKAVKYELICIYKPPTKQLL